MKPEYESRGVGGAQFHTTRWTLVMVSAELISMDWESAERRCPPEPANHFTAEKIFDARCAMTLLNEAMTLLRKEYAAQDKASKAIQ
ncbi:MAG: hypothetical protein JO279_13025 [Verrucomicrobia bacterium]|nr:hypothetical protein [Verrucomicrobiota bacterium]